MRFLLLSFLVASAAAEPSADDDGNGEVQAGAGTQSEFVFTKIGDQICSGASGMETEWNYDNQLEKFGVLPQSSWLQTKCTEQFEVKPKGNNDVTTIMTVTYKVDCSNACFRHITEAENDELDESSMPVAEWNFDYSTELANEEKITFEKNAMRSDEVKQLVTYTHPLVEKLLNAHMDLMRISGNEYFEEDVEEQEGGEEGDQSASEQAPPPAVKRDQSASEQAPPPAVKRDQADQNKMNAAVADRLSKWGSANHM